MNAKRSSKKSPLTLLLSSIVAIVVAAYGLGLFDSFLPNIAKSDNALEEILPGSSDKTSLDQTALEESADPQRHIQVAKNVLAQMPQQERCSHSGYAGAACQVPSYDREGQFGRAWVDVDQDGCRTREQVLARDMTNVQQAPDCYVHSGTLEDPYTGKVLTDRSKVDIDHIIPLALAWDMGANNWDQGTRVAFANDPDVNLIAVDGKVNQQDKKDKTLSEWEPDTDYACTYAIKYIWALDQYGLPITPDDYNAASGHLNTCEVVYGEPTDSTALGVSVRQYASKY